MLSSKNRKVGAEGNLPFEDADAFEFMVQEESNSEKINKQTKNIELTEISLQNRINPPDYWLSLRKVQQLSYRPSCRGKVRI